MRMIDADALRDIFTGQPPEYYTTAYLTDLIDRMPTVAMGTDHVMINWTPDIDKLARDVAFRGLNEFSYMGKSIREWVDIIMEQYAMKKQSEWVSVEDRLPDKYGSYLTLREGQLMPPQTRMAVHFWTGNKDGNYWRGAEAGSRITGITHWRALPELPKDEMEEILGE